MSSDLQKVLKLKKYNIKNSDNFTYDDLFGIEDLLKDCFYSSINYYSPKNGWDTLAFQEFLKDTLNNNVDLKDKIKVYIKEPNTPEYIVLWDKFDKEEIENFLSIEKYKDYAIIDNYWLGVTFKYYIRNTKTIDDIIIRRMM